MVASLHQGPPLQPHQGTATPFRQGPSPTRSAPVGRAYVINETEAATSDTIVTATFFLYVIPFCVLFDLDATHFFISTESLCS